MNYQKIFFKAYTLLDLNSYKPTKCQLFLFVEKIKVDLNIK